MGTRYYVGALKQGQAAYPDQRRFLSRLRNADSRITVHLGRIEPRPVPNELSIKLLDYLARAVPSLDAEMAAQLLGLAHQHAFVSVFKEKETDVQLAIDMYKLAVEDKFDAGYLLSADGDFAPAVEAVRSLDKKVYVACPSPGLALQNVANRFIRLQPAWFQDCYRFE